MEVLLVLFGAMAFGSVWNLALVLTLLLHICSALGVHENAASLVNIRHLTFLRVFLDVLGAMSTKLKVIALTYSQFSDCALAVNSY